MTRIAPTKDLAVLKGDALAALDQMHAAKRPASINSDLYALKRNAALHVLAGGASPLVSGETEARNILDKAAAADALVAELERARQSAQADIRGASDWFALQSAIKRHMI